MSTLHLLVPGNALARTIGEHRPLQPRQKGPAKPESGAAAARRGGFTLVELVAVLAILALAVTMLAPALARSRTNGKAVQCLYNQRQLAAAWQTYAADNNDRLAVNSGGSVPPFSYPVSWAGGFVDWSSSPMNTNTLYLTEDRTSLLAAYAARSAGIFWCPTDTYLSPAQRLLGWAHRIRSVAMNAAVGDGNKDRSISWSSSFWWARKTGDLTAPGPSQSWVFLDEHPDSIEDTIFYANPGFTNGTGQFTELPASDHSGACGIAFADGHAEIHRWLERGTLLPVGSGITGPISVVNNADLAWLAQHTPRRP
jgi:prepilin-type N-terminal cleavage/methylation domain-containing protein/prepilin-type processing-associated H-X9-DG protein